MADMTSSDPTGFPGTGKTLPLDNHACFAMYNGIHSMQRLYRPWFTDWGITYPQYLVLVALWDNDVCAGGATTAEPSGGPAPVPGPDQMSVKELGARLHLDSGTLSPLLKRMEAGGLVQRTRSAQDNRRVTVELTEKGTALQEQAREMQLDIARQLDLTVHEAELLTDIAARMERAAGE